MILVSLLRPTFTLFRNSIGCTYTMSNLKIQLFEKRINEVERTISTLKREVDDLKSDLKTLKNCENDSKKRKVAKFTLNGDLGNDEGSEKDLPEFVTDEEGYVHVYTDGACENNGKRNAKAGLGVWFAPKHPLNIGEPVRRRATNNVGEIEACTRAIQIARGAGVRKLLINTDSEFVINCITKWIISWKRKNWMTAAGHAVINKDELLELDEHIKLMEDVKWNHVRGHRGILGNEAADALARQGAAQYKI